MAIDRRIKSLEARIPIERPFTDIEEATDAQLIAIVLAHPDAILQERARALGRPLRPSEVTDEDLLRIAACGRS